MLDDQVKQFIDLSIINQGGKNQVPQMLIRSLLIAQNDDE